MEEITLKKRLFTLILILLTGVMFAGCSLTSINATRYSDEVMVKVGDETVTRRELSSLFNSYYNQYGSSTDSDTIFDVALSQLINQKVLINEAKKVVLLSNEDKNAIWQQVFDAINQEIDSIMLEEGYIDDIEDDEEETTGYGYVRTEQTQVSYDKDTFDYKTDVVINSEFEKPTEGNRLTCFNKLLSQLVATAKSNGKNTNTDVVFAEYVNTLYTSYENAKYAEKYEDYLKAGVSVSGEEVIAEYNKLLNTQLQKYADSDVFNNALNNSTVSDLILYATEAKYFTVKHILISFTDEQTEELQGMTGYNTSLDIVYNEPYENKKAEFASNLMITTYTDLNTGEVFESEEGFDRYYDVVNKKYVTGDEATLLVLVGEKKVVTVDTIKNLVKNIMTDATLTNNQKLSYFDQLMFIYGQDPGMQTDDMMAGKAGYIIPDPDSDEFEDMSFQAEFKLAAKDAREEYLAAHGYTGDGYKIAYTANGVHIIVFTGMIGNIGTDGYYYESTNGGYYLVQASSANQTVTADDLKATTIGGFSGVEGAKVQSVYDYIYESLLASKQSEALSNFVANTRANYENNKDIVKYKSTYKEAFGQ